MLSDADENEPGIPVLFCSYYGVSARDVLHTVEEFKNELAVTLAAHLEHASVDHETAKLVRKLMRLRRGS